MKEQNAGKSWIITALTAVGLVLVGWFGRELMPTFGGAARTGGGAAAPTVAVAKVGKRAVNPVDWYVGHVEPIQEVDVLPQIDGYLAKVNFNEGDFVKAGDVLFEIDQERYLAENQISKANLARAEAEVGQTEAALEKSQRYWKRMSSVDQRGVAQSERDAAETDLAADKAQLLRAKAAVKESQAQLAVSEFNLRHTVIRAPFSGRIGKTFAHVGDYVAPSKGPMAHLVQVDPVRVTFPMSDRSYLELDRRAKKADKKIGELLRLRLRLADGSVYPGEGRWDFADNEMSAEAAAVSIRVEFDNAEEMLKPKAYVEVLTDEKSPSVVLAVPKKALVHGSVVNGLWILKDDGTVTLREVSVGRSDGAYAEILGGVAEGETYVLQGVSKVSEGRKVEVVPAVDFGSRGGDAR